MGSCSDNSTMLVLSMVIQIAICSLNCLLFDLGDSLWYFSDLWVPIPPVEPPEIENFERIRRRARIARWLLASQDG